LGDVIACGRFDGHFIDHAGAGVQVLVGVGFTDGLQHGLVDLACLWMRAARGGEAVDDAVHLTKVGLDGGDDFRLDRIGEGVAIE